MDWHYITPHLISGCIPVFALLVLYFIILYVLGKKQPAGHIIVSLVFCCYLVGVLIMTGICLKASFSPRIVWIPFVDMIRGPIDTILNVLFFVPMGFFLALLYKEFDKVGRIAIAGFIISLSIEIIQMFGFGSTDINDLITNTIGACLGYALYKLLRPAIPDSLIRRIQVEGSQCYYELSLFWIGTILIMLTVQLQIFHAFF